MKRSTVATVAMGAVIALVAAGCSSEETEPSPSSSPLITFSAPAPTVLADPIVTPSPSPSATEAVDPHPDADALVISSSGIGPLAVGNVGVENNPGVEMIEWNPTYCADDPDDPFSGRWIPAGYDDADVDLEGNPTWPFTVDADAAAIHRIDVLGVGPRTSEGIGLGSTLTEMILAHPGLVGPYEFDDSQVWVLYGLDGALTFELVPGDGADDEATVAYIRIMHPEAPAEFAVVGTDDVAGAC